MGGTALLCALMASARANQVEVAQVAEKEWDEIRFIDFLQLQRKNVKKKRNARALGAFLAWTDSFDINDQESGDIQFHLAGNGKVGDEYVLFHPPFGRRHRERPLVAGWVIVIPRRSDDPVDELAFRYWLMDLLCLDDSQRRLLRKAFRLRVFQHWKQRSTKPTRICRSTGREFELSRAKSSPASRGSTCRCQARALARFIRWLDESHGHH